MIKRSHVFPGHIVGVCNCTTVWQSFPYRLHNAVQMKQKDKQNISQLEKKLKAEQEARSFVEKQLMEEKKRKKLEEATAARAVAFAAASRYVHVTWVLNPRLAFLVPGQPWEFDVLGRIGNKQSCTDGLLLSMVLLADLNSICASLCSLVTASSLGDLIRKVGWGNHHASHTWRQSAAHKREFPVTFFKSDNY